jgi:hypothetical protein
MLYTRGERARYAVVAFDAYAIDLISEVGFESNDQGRVLNLRFVFPTTSVDGLWASIGPSSDVYVFLVDER